MGQPIITADRVAVEWWATMIDPDDGEITLPGCLLLRFASDGHCRDLWEYWQTRPGRQDPPHGWAPDSPPASHLVAGSPAARHALSAALHGRRSSPAMPDAHITRICIHAGRHAALCHPMIAKTFFMT